MSKPLDDLAGRESDKKLKELFENFLDYAAKNDCELKCADFPSYTRQRKYYDLAYSYAGNLLKDVHTSVGEIHGLLAKRELSKRERCHAGFFISAFYNKSELADIVYDQDIWVENLAYRLPADKVFINLGSGYENSGTESDGIIINYVRGGESSEISAGYCARGAMITYGADATSENYVIDYGTDGLELVETASLNVVVNKEVEIHQIKNYYPFNGLSAKQIVKIPELRAYVDNLVWIFEQGRSDYKSVVKAVRDLGPNPKEKIQNDLFDIVKRSCPNV